MGALPNKLEAKNYDELLYSLRNIDSYVGPRIKIEGTPARASEECEWWVLKNFLMSLEDIKCFHFPIVIVKSESPDFIIKIKSNENIGVEITEAIPERYAKILSEMERNNISISSIGLEMYQEIVCGKAYSIQDIIKIESNDDSELKKTYSAGWTRGEAERIFIKCIKKCIDKKGEKLKNFSNNNKNWLIIYNNTGLIMVDMDNCISQIKDRVSSDFDKVYLLGSDGNKVYGLT